jgi:hypothetical protein
MLVQLYEHLLCQVFRFSAISDQAVEQAVYAIIMAGKERLEGLYVPLLDAF